MGMSRKVLEKKNAKEDEGARLLYFALPPPHGINGVERARLVDVDECGVWLATCRRKYGHVDIGKKAATNAPYNVGKKFTVILAIDVGGVVCYTLSDSPGTTTLIFFNFINHVLLPSIEGTHPDGRVIVWDNLRAHFNQAVLQLIRNEGHVIVPRPKFSCDLGSIEFGFSVIKTNLRSHWYDVDEDNLPDYVEAAICSLTGDQCEGFFRHTGH